MDLLPEGNESYGKQSYWDERYTKEDPEATFDWFKTYSDISHLIHEFVPLKSSSILILGCGNSTLSADLYDDGYENITNVDYSSVVISKMTSLNLSRPRMKWEEGDVRSLSYDTQSFDVCIDKGTMDALMTAKGDVWDPSPEIIQACKEEVDSVIRVLRPSGVFLYLTFGQPHFRKPHLKREGWEVLTREVGEGFCYYFYVMRRVAS